MRFAHAFLRCICGVVQHIRQQLETFGESVRDRIQQRLPVESKARPLLPVAQHGLLELVPQHYGVGLAQALQSMFQARLPLSCMHKAGEERCIIEGNEAGIIEVDARFPWNVIMPTPCLDDSDTAEKRVSFAKIRRRPVTHLRFGQIQYRHDLDANGEVAEHNLAGYFRLETGTDCD